MWSRSIIVVVRVMPPMVLMITIIIIEVEIECGSVEPVVLRNIVFVLNRPTIGTFVMMGCCEAPFRHVVNMRAVVTAADFYDGRVGCDRRRRG